MKNIFKRITVILMGALMLISTTGCLEDGSSSESSKTTSTPNKTISETKTEPVTTDAKVYADQELKINYSRPSGNPSIKVGSKGDDVSWVQSALNKALNTNITVDGDFGGGTESKVIEFQSRAGLSADGVVGPATVAALADVIKGDKTLAKVTEPPKTTPPVTQPPKVNPPVTQPPVKHEDPPVVQQPVSKSYIVNTNTGKFHYSSCSSVGQMNEENKWYYTGTRDDLISQGYSPCGRCHP